jgi:hypothetical protein
MMNRILGLVAAPHAGEARKGAAAKPKARVAKERREMLEDELFTALPRYYTAEYHPAARSSSVG